MGSLAVGVEIERPFHFPLSARVRAARWSWVMGSRQVVSAYRYGSLGPGEGEGLEGPMIVVAGNGCK